MLNEKPTISSKQLGRLINWVMVEHEKLIQVQKEHLPPKAQRVSQPHIMWIKTPFHNCFSEANNDARSRFNTCLCHTCKYNDNVSVLQLKQVWQPTDSSLYVKHAERFTNEGIRTYWDAMDRTVKFCDTTIMKRIFKTEYKPSHTHIKCHNIYQWRKN